MSAGHPSSPFTALPSTSVTLVNGLRFPGNREQYERAWEKFYKDYSPVIGGWFRMSGRLSADAAADLAQEFHVRLVETVREFEYDCRGSFRAWLRVCVRNHLVNFFRDHKEALPLPEGVEWIQAVESLDERLQRLFDLELWQTARSRVQKQVSGRDWAIYVESAEQGESDSIVAERYQVSPGVVYTVKWRVKSCLKQEVMRLEQSGVTDGMATESNEFQDGIPGE